MNVSLAVIFFMHRAAPLAFRKSEQTKCLGSEKLNFVDGEGAALIPMEDWR